MVTFNPINSNNPVRPSDLNGHLVAIKVHEFKPNFDTKYGPKDAVRLTVYDIDDERTYEGVVWIATFLVWSLKALVGGVVLVRLSQGQGRPGRLPPWVLKDATGDSIALAKAELYLKSLG